jgi:hypothetical protein
MKTVIAVVVLLCGLTVGQQPQAALSQYVIVAHKGYDYTVRHGRALMKVTYGESQARLAPESTHRSPRYSDRLAP